MEQQPPTTPPSHDELMALRRIALAHLYRRIADPTTPPAELYLYSGSVQAITPTLGTMDDLAPLGHAYLQHRLTVERDEHADLMDLRKLRRSELTNRARKARKTTKKPKLAKAEAEAS